MESSERPGPGRRLGRYELLRLIGEGGMAQVWAARMDGPRGFRKIFAIKTLLPALARDPAFQRMFLDEAHLASRVRHRNVVEIVELGEQGGTLFLVMEWVDGQSLQRMLRPGRQAQRLHPGLAARVVADAAVGLHAAHELRDERGAPLGIVHRDVCPQNILLARDGTVKVADFGIVKAIERLGDTTQTGEIKGKGEYMSPEQARSRPVDRRSDVFSLGVVLFEAVTGERPFQGPSDIVVMQRIASAEAPRPTLVAPGCPAELEWIILTALAREPERRFQTAQAMAEALEQLIARATGAVTAAQIAEELHRRCGDRMDELRRRIEAAAAPGDGGPAPVAASVPPPPPAEAPAPMGTAAAWPPPAAMPSPITPAAGNLALSAAPAAPRRPLVPSLIAATAMGVAAAALVFAAVGRRGEPAARACEPSAGDASGRAPVALHGPPISVRLTPGDAVVRLEGAVIGVGDQLIARPAPGASLSVEARAEGRAPRQVTLTSESPERIDIELAPAK
ncbi:MAG: protein kinase [Polyangiaceae bacterium]|nr:protein kinase [Polyangiaceae bacterium]